MSKFIIQGGRKLEGEVTISGSKNAALPIIAATILNSGVTTLYNVPNIKDVQTMFEIIKEIGGNVVKKNNKIIIDTSKVHRFEIPENLMRKMRSSVILAGAIIGRYKEVKFSYPGGCDIGSRPIDLHLKSFEKMGIKINENTSYIECKCDKIDNTIIQLDFPSVGATENIILSSVLGNHEITIKNAAREPEIIDLVNFLNRMGAKVNGAGTSEIKVKGVTSLKEVSYRIMPDRIEAGTFLIATAMTGGYVKLNNINPEHISPILHKLRECGCKIKEEKYSITINVSKRLNGTDFKTLPYPGFPTDLQPIFSTLLTVCKGTSIVTENIFENRFKFMQELKRMGAKCSIEGKTLIIKGVKKLHGAIVESTDLRGGAALVIAAISAKGITRINKIEHILRGYEELDYKLNMLGANIVREEEEI